MARLFISYNRRDAPYAWAIRQWLMDEQGWASEDIFFDAEHLHAGVDWQKKLLAEAEAAEVMLFLASEHSLNIDSFCYRELKHANGQILAVTVGGVAYNDDRLDRALPESAKSRQVTALDKPPTRPFSYVSPEDGVTQGSVELDPDCVAGIGTTLRELGVAPNSYTWTPKSDEDSPYPGLRPLNEGDEALFCGRDLEIRNGIQAIEELRASVTKKALVIQAPSGAGKSSFLRAGLWHRLRRNPGFTPLAIVRTPNSVIQNDDWGLVRGLFHTLSRSREIRERNLELSYQDIGERAANDLPGLLVVFADADAGPSGRRTLLIGIDQAEEMTALSPEDDAELDRLLGVLLHLPGDLDLRLVLTARDDSVDATLERLARAGLPQEQVETWRLNRIPSSRLDEIIKGPAEAARKASWPITFEAGLVDALVEAAGAGDDSADALPILAITLQRMVARCRTPDGKITLQPGEAKKFVRDVVSDAVAEALQASSASRDDLRRLVIPCLATWDPDAGSEGAAKRQVAGEAHLFSGERAGLKLLADALVAQRLLTLSKTGSGAAYEVTHEALLRVPPLEDMILDCREKFEQVRILEVETREWIESGKSPANLVRFGGRLQDALDLAEDTDFGAGLREKDVGGVRVIDYLEACRDHEEAEEKRKARNRRRVIAGLSTTTVVALALAGAALWAVQNALKSRDDGWRVEGVQALKTARTSPDVYPDRIFRTAIAIGFSDAGTEYRPRRFLAPSFWREAWVLLSNAEREDLPILAPHELDTARDELSTMPAYLPFWRSASLGSPVTGLEVSATHLRAGYGDGTVREWELGTPKTEAVEGKGEVSPVKESTGVELDGTSVRLKAFGHNVDLTCHPSEATAWAFPADEAVLYIGMKDGSVMAWDLRKSPVGDRDLRSYFSRQWLEFDRENQKLLGKTTGQADEFLSLPVPERKPHVPGSEESFRNSLGMELVRVAPGTFVMGSDSEDASDDETPHEVTLTREFWMGAYEVTQAEWKAVMGENPSDFKDPLAPVECVDWNQVKEFCRKLTERERAAGTLPEGLVYELPSEAQWEYACRAGTKTEYFFGNEILPDQANFSSSAIGRTVAVGRYPANPWGLYDMHGNVYEWCQDWYGDYPKDSVKHPPGPATGGFRVFRGGGWFDLARDCRSASRDRDLPVVRGDVLGFRVALSSAPPGPSGPGEPEANPGRASGGPEEGSEARRNDE